MAVRLAARLLASVAGLLPLAPRTCEALLLDSASRVAEVGGEGGRDRDPSRVSPAFPICFIHVGKCAGGTLNQTLLKIQRNSANNWDMLGIHVPNGPVSNPEVEHKCLSRDIVLWVRDPMDRLMASWRWEIEFHHGRGIYDFACRNPDLFPECRSSKLVLNLNHVAGAIEQHAASGGRSLDADFLGSFHHGYTGLAWYVGENAVELAGVPNEKIFVGRTEHMQEDWERLLVKLQVPLRNDTGLVAKIHETRTTEPLSSAAATLLRRVAQPEYNVLKKLVSRGLLSADYLDSISNRTDYVTRLPKYLS